MRSGWLSLQIVVFIASAATAADHGPVSQAKPIAAKHDAATARQAATSQTKANGSWRISTTANFCIYHRNDVLARAVGKTAEQSLQASRTFWFGKKSDGAEAWRPRCEIFLYPADRDFASHGRGMLGGRGQAAVVKDGRLIVSRKIVVKADDKNLLNVVLPHEITHVMLGTHFAPHSLPHWADEGMAMFAELGGEPTRRVPQLGVNGSRLAGMTCFQIMQLTDYPRGADVRWFYAQSHQLCKFLTDRGGPDRLVIFLETALRKGEYDKALAEIYDLSSFSELDFEFRRYVASQ